MATKSIIVGTQIFPCPIGWTVNQARDEIRSRFGLQNGGLDENGIPVLGSAMISSFRGNLTFVGGQFIQQQGKIINLCFHSYFLICFIFCWFV